MTITRVMVFDTETTDMDPEQGAEVCEVGYSMLELPDEGAGDWDFTWTHTEGAWSFVETVAPMNPAARGTHHIAPAQCAPGAPNCVPRSWAVTLLKNQLHRGVTALAAHNAPFDLKFVPELQALVPVIDTLKVAKHLYPDCPNYKNQTLRYYLDAEPPADHIAGLDAHRTQYDAAVTAAILKRMLEERSAEDLVELTRQPVLLKTCTFGKHRGQLWADLPADYLGWMVRSSDMYRDDEDIRHTVDHYLERPSRRRPEPAEGSAARRTRAGLSTPRLI